MVAFNHVQTECGGQEMDNVGLMVESGTTLYQINTAATITPDGQVSENPVIHGCSSSHIVCVAADKQLLLFQEECQQFLFAVGLDSHVDCVTCSQHGDFVAVGESNGCLHFLTSSCQHPLISKQLIEENDLKSQGEVTFRDIVFTPISEEGTCDLLVLATQGQIYHFQNLQLTQLNEALVSKDIARLQHLQKDIKVDILDVTCVHSEMTLSVQCLPTAVGSSILTAGSGEIALAMWNKTEYGYICSKASPAAFECPVTKVAMTKCANSLFTLDSKSHLTLWSSHTLTCIRLLSDSVVDFGLQEAAEEATGFNHIKLVMLTVDQDDNHSLQICSFPCLEPLYQLHVNKLSWLVSSPSLQESVLLVEGATDESSFHGDQPDLIDSLKIRCLMETLPETRFHRLLNKKLFEEAHSFAKLFKLDEEPIYKTKAGVILNSLTSTAEDHLLGELKVCLSNIHNDDYVVENCIKAPLSNAGDVFDLLTFAKNRLEKSQSISNGHRVDDVDKSVLLTKVLETLYRLDTFFDMYGVHYFTTERWEEFRKISLVQESLRYLSLGDISKVISLWGRHPREFHANVSCDIVEDILANVSAEIPSKDLTYWLTAHLIPFIIQQCPASLVTFVSWLEQRALNLEIEEKDDWPQNALHLCDLAILQQFTSEDHDLPISSEIITEQLDDTTETFKRLAALIQHLRQFCHFCSEYNCHFSFADYLQETTESLAHRMLDRIVATELIRDFIGKTIQKYTKEYSLDRDCILYEYVKRLTGFKMAQQAGQTLWESKAIIIIGCIHNDNYKMDAILDMILRAYIPWSQEMEDLVNEGLTMKHQRVTELHKRCRLAALKKMLSNYDLPHYNVSETSNAQRLVNYIVKQDRVTAVSDALEVVKAYSHVSEDTVYLRYLIEHQLQEESLELLRSLPQQLQLSCGKQLVIGTRLLLGSNSIVFNQQETNARRLLQTSNCCHVLRHLLTLDLPADEREDFEELLYNLQNIHVLQVEFGEFISYEDYCSDNTRQAMCRKWLSERQTKDSEKKKPRLPVTPDSQMGDFADRKPGLTVTSDSQMRDFGDRKPGLTSTSDNNIYALARILNIDRDELCNQQMISAIEAGRMDAVTHWCSRLCQQLPTRQTARKMFKATHCLCTLLATRQHEEAPQQLPGLIRTLASEAVTHCSKDLLVDCLQLCVSVSLADDVLQQCQTTDFSESTQQTAQKVGGKDPFTEWAFDDFFHEYGLMLEPAQVISTVYNCTLMSVFPHSMAETESSLQRRVRALLPVTNLLKDNGHQTLAVQYCEQTVTTMIQRVTSEMMGFSDLSTLTIQLQTRNMQLLQTVMSESFDQITQMTSSLLVKVLSQQPVDHALCVGLLCNLPRKLALELMQKSIKKLGFHYKQILGIVCAGKYFASLCGNQKMYDAYSLLELDAFWGHKLAKLKVSFKGVFGLSRVEKRKLLPQLCRSPSVHVADIRQFCSDYTIEEDEPLMVHLRYLLGERPKLSPGGTIAQEEDDAAVMSLFSGVIELIGVFHNTELLLPGLRNMITQIDPYDYRRLEFVLEHMARLSSEPSVKKHQKLLSFLFEYKRVAPASSYELDYYIARDKELVTEDKVMPAIAHTRLPFHLLTSGTPWKIISPELDADTLPVWLPVIPVLQLSTDHAYITAIHNTVQKHLKTADRQPISTSTHSQAAQLPNGAVDASFLDTVQCLLHGITNLQLAVGCSNSMVTELVVGEEKVATAKWTMELASKWLKEATQDAEREDRSAIYTKICGRYRCEATQQILAANHVALPDLLQWTTRPAKLIYTLYQQYGVLTQTLGSEVTCQPDINKMAYDIARVNKVNVQKIQLNLFEKWLKSTSPAKEDDLDVTLDTTLCQTDDVDDAEAESNLMRVNYLLQCMPTESRTKFLLGYAFYPNTLDKINNLGRVRALRSLFSLTDSKTIETLSQMTTSHIRSVMCDLRYIVKLEALQMSQTLESFSKCNKVGLVKTILRNHSRKSQAVRLAAELCLDYSIFEVPLWTNILKQFITFQMVDFSHKILVRLLPVPVLLQVSAISIIWKAILMAPLLSAVRPVSGTQLDVCLRTLILLRRYPLLQDLNLAAFCQCYLQLDLPVCAVVCARLIPAPDRRATSLTLTQSLLTALQQQLQRWTQQASTDPTLHQLLLVAQHMETESLVSMFGPIR